MQKAHSIYTLYCVMKSSHDIISVVEDDWEEGDSVEADGVMEIVTECWVEPQNGVVVSPSPRANHLNNCSYRQLAQAVSTYPYLCYRDFQIYAKDAFL